MEAVSGVIKGSTARSVGVGGGIVKWNGDFQEVFVSSWRDAAGPKRYGM
jgi:hypothetical protein